MGNCVFKDYGEVEEMVKVVTSNGGIMELYAPIKAESITNEFPGHAIFRSQEKTSPPLLHNENLHAGELYYLLPLDRVSSKTAQEEGDISKTRDNNVTNIRHISMATPYRMSFHHNRTTGNERLEPEVFPRYNNTGVWKVRLVINPEQLSEILSQEARTEALIESVRTVAKCGTAVSSMANSDQWSVPSSWKTDFSDHCTPQTLNFTNY